VSIYEIPINRLDGTPSTLAEFEGQTVLMVNVASKCGLTGQYATLEALQKQYSDKGFSVIGFPSNEFMGQEPGTPAEIQEFCTTTYGVSFPLMEKIEVNGDNRHPIYAELAQATDASGDAGDVQWNFEKFLVSPTGEVVARFRPMVEPDSDEIIGAIEANLPG